MKILLDECIPFRLRHRFASHEAHTVQWAGFKNKKNGELLRAAEDAGYDVLLTVDQEIPHQQNRAGRRLSIVILCAASNDISDLTPLVDRALAALETIQPGEIVTLREP